MYSSPMYHRPRDGSPSTESPVDGPLTINKDLVAATSTPLVLAILTEGDSYGYAILKRVRELSGGEL